MAAPTVEFFTDPLSPWCWAAQPPLRRLQADFDLSVTPRATVLLPDTSDDEHLPGSVEDPASLPAVWREAASTTGMPVAPALWDDGVPSSSRPACAACAFVREARPERANAFLRRVREAAFVDGWRMDDAASLATVATDVAGVDASTVRRALHDGRAEDALEDDLRRACAMGAELPSVDVRGDVGTLPAAPRHPAFEADASETDGSDADGGEDGEGSGAEGTEPRLVAPPALRFDDGDVTVVNPGVSYGRIASVLGRSLPQTGLTVDDKYAVSRMAMHVPREMAESLSAQDFSEEVYAYLDRFEGAFPVEVATGTGKALETCQSALSSLAAEGVARRDESGQWRTIDTGGGRRR